MVDGDGAGIERQREDTERLASGRGWQSRLYADESVSAYKTRVKRPMFERLLEDLSNDVLQGVVVYDIDRLARQPKDLERLIDLYDANPKLVFASCQGDIDLATSDGRFMARILVSVANKSSADTGRRVTRAHLQLAQKGVPVGGNRPFGWKADKRTIDPTEADLIRQAAADILAGKGLHTIRREWTAAGVPTVTGTAWSKQVIRNIMISPRLVGYRVYRGQIAVDASGSPVKALSEPILDVDTWEAVRAVITDPARSGAHVHIGGRKYLLSGIARCGECSGLLRGNADTRWSTFFYACGGCGKVGISGPRTDAAVTAVVLAYLAGRHVEHSPMPFPHEAELADATTRIADLMQAYTSKQLSGQVVFPAVERLEREAAELRSEHAAWLREQVAIIRPVNVADRWEDEDLTVEQRRLVIESVVQAVTVKRAAHRGGSFDKNRLDLIWRQYDSTPRGTTAALH